MVAPLWAKAGFNGFRSFWSNFHLILLLALQWWEPSIPFTQLPSCCPSWDENPALLALVLPTSEQKWFVPPWHNCLDAYSDGGCLAASPSLYMPYYPQVPMSPTWHKGSLCRLALSRERVSYSFLCRTWPVELIASRELLLFPPFKAADRAMDLAFNFHSPIFLVLFSWPSPLCH